MATTTARLGLRKPAGTDLVAVATDVSGNADIIEAAVDRTCTSSTRPSSPWIGMRAYETDTKRIICCTQVTPSIEWIFLNAISGVSTSRPSTTGTQDLTTGSLFYETDTHNSVTWNSSQWEHSSIPVVASTAAILAPYGGQLVLSAADNLIYKYNGSAWVGCVAVGGSTAATRHEARYYQATPQSGLVAGTATAMTFDTAQYSCNDVTPSGTGNNLFTLNRDGNWRITWSYRAAGGTISGATAECLAVIATATGNNTNRFATDNKFGNASSLTYMGNITCEKQFAATSTLAFNIQINNSGTWATAFNSESNSISFKWIGPIA